jgi:hypothetical protein
MQTNIVLDFATFRKFSDTMIETGLAQGTGVKSYLAAGFKLVRSVEYVDTIYQSTAEHFKDNKQVQLYLGRSDERLPEMMLGFENTRVIFMLDAHPSGENTGGHDDLIKNGEASTFHQNNILLAELEVIGKLPYKNHVILIDDQNGANNYNKVYQSKILGFNPTYKFYFFDSIHCGVLQKDKCMVCIPGDICLFPGFKAM